MPKGDNDDRDAKIRIFLRQMGYNFNGDSDIPDDFSTPAIERALGRRPSGFYGAADASGEALSAQFEEFWSNYLNEGSLPKTLDPTEAIGQSERLSGVYQAAAMGMGIGGLFGKGGQNYLAPLQPNVPSAGPPIPKAPGLVGPPSIFKR